MSQVPVNANILSWARETAGLSLEEAVARLKIGKAFGQTPKQRLESLEAGGKAPSRALLIRMSKVYRRPLLTFYLAEPPRKGDRGEDFRRLPNDYSISEEALVDALVRDVRARQSLVRAVLEDEEEATLLSFVGSTSIQDGRSAVRQKLVSDLKFDVRIFRAQRTLEDAFAYARGQAEQVGLFVLLIGDLGSHHTALSVESFRGFAIADNIAPFVVINDQDSRAAWSFTLLHELAHVWLGKTGISSVFAETTLERFCNDVASAMLLDDTELKGLEVTNQTSVADAVERIDSFAHERNISRAMVAYRLLRARVIEVAMWASLRAEFKRLWVEQRDRKRAMAREKETGPSYYTIRRHRVGKALLDLIARMTSRGAITSTKAGKVLGVRPHNVFEMLKEAA
jgi:Zn-dependent peptidase ImmA (M78 family)